MGNQFETDPLLQSFLRRHLPPKLHDLIVPDLRTFVSSGFFRGLCSGLGLLDIWIGFWEALHYHENK